MTPSLKKQLEEMAYNTDQTHPTHAFMAGAQAALDLTKPSDDDYRDADRYAGRFSAYPGGLHATDAAAFLAGRYGLREAVEAAVLAERERCAEVIAEMRRNYPEDIFTPIYAGEPDPIVRDRISAHMARHVLDQVLNEIINPKESK